MPAHRLHHVQLTCPPGTEDTLRSFYVGVLGMTEIPKPPELAARGGCWFRIGPEGDGIELHLGVQNPFAPSVKGHPGMIWDDVDAAAARLEAAGHRVAWDGLFPGMRRFYTDDPHGNRLEFLSPE